MCAPERISLVISVPRTIITGQEFPRLAKTSVVILSANGRPTHVRYCQRTMGRWVEKEVLHVFHHPSISRISEEDQYQAFFRYVSTKEYPAVVDNYVFVKKTIADLLQTDHSLHEHSDSGGFFSLQRQQERGRKATIVGSLLQSFAAADYQMIQCSHCNQYHVNCTDVPKTVLNNNKARWLCEFCKHCVSGLPLLAKINFL